MELFSNKKNHSKLKRKRLLQNETCWIGGNLEIFKGIIEERDIDVHIDLTLVGRNGKQVSGNTF